MFLKAPKSLQQLFLVGTGISTAVFTQWSRGDYNLKLDKLSLIAKFFGISVSDFIEDDETCKKESS